MDPLEAYDKSRKEENEVVIFILNQLHYFQCHVRGNIVVVWCGQNLLSEKPEKLETWMAHFEQHFQCIYPPPTSLGIRLDNPATITSDD